MSQSDVVCRSCGHNELDSVLDLGTTALADRMLYERQLNEPEPAFPLEVVFCPKCSLVQIMETVDPEVLFDEDYPYFSSFSNYLLDHSKKNVLELIARRGLGADSFVVELASNDGYLLKNYVDNGVGVLGIDPVPALCEAAEKIGVPSRAEFFGIDVAKGLVAEGKQADVIHANNVLAHVADTNGFVAGIAALLKDDGMAVIEFPYVRDLIDHCEFDTIYHEHLCYFSVTAVDHLLRRHGLYLNDCWRLPIHGGSLRLFIEKKDAPLASVTALLAEEKELGLDRIDYYHKFSDRVAALKVDLLQMLKDLKADGKSIAAYGAAAKGSTMINYVGVGKDLLDFVADKNVHKQGRYMPGQKIPIVAAEKIQSEQPDYVLLLPWNLKSEILAQEQAFRDAGGKFIIPVPTPHIV
ncbi:MAG: SAM-dependent methyltransferase [Candidatus Krumholzibacteriia bacterium]|jgi:SAM-dependent methyltransferase